MNTQTTQTNKSQLFTSFAIILSAVMIAVVILGFSGGLSFLGKKFWNSIPKPVHFNKLTDLDTASLDINKAIESQPIISLSKNPKYILVESSSMNCLNCASLYKGIAQEKSTYEKILSDFVLANKMGYMWIDHSADSGDVREHTALYCAAEQSAKKFFDFKEETYKNYTANYDIEDIKKIAKSVGLNPSKLEECINSKKYESRVSALTQLSSDLGTVLDPAFYIYKLEEKEVENTEGKKEKRTIVTKVNSFSGLQNYDTSIKPTLETSISQK